MTRVVYALGTDDAPSQDGVPERRFSKAVTDIVDYAFGVGVSGRRPSRVRRPRRQGWRVGARGGADIKKVLSLRVYRGAGAECGLKLQTVHDGMPFCVVMAVDSLLWPSRDRFAGIPGRRRLLGGNLRRLGDDFGTQKWT